MTRLRRHSLAAPAMTYRLPVAGATFIATRAWSPRRSQASGSTQPARR